MQVQIDHLHRFAQLRSDLDSRRTLLKQTLSGTVEWSGVLHDVSLVMPQRMWLNTMTGTLNATTPGAVPATVVSSGSMEPPDGGDPAPPGLIGEA